jgi:hypothetical protein
MCSVRNPRSTLKYVLSKYFGTSKSYDCVGFGY